MFKRKLFKRALPVILSVAMVFQSMPATAMAAESTTEPETVIEQMTDEIVVDDGDDNEAADGQDDGANEESEAAEETDAAEEATVAETQTADESKAAEETDTAAEEIKDAAETEAVESEVEDHAEAALDTNIVLDESSLKNNYLGQGVSYDDNKSIVYATYSEDASNPFDTVKDVIKNNVQVEVDGTGNEDLKDKLSYQWQAKDADDYTDMSAGAVPVNAGVYRLVITMPKVDGACNEAAAALDFEIRKAEIEVGDIDFTVAPGTTVKEFTDAVKEDYTLRLNGVKLNKTVYVKDVEVVVKDAITGTTVTDETTAFVNTSDYVATVAITLNDSFASNYTLPGYEVDDLTEQKITVADLIETEIQVTNKLEDAGKVITKTYDGKEADARTLVEPNITVAVVTPNEVDETTDEPAVIKEATYDTLEKVWVDANDIELKDENGKDFAPVDAGTYYYVLKYAGKEGVYTESEARIKVVIEPAKLVLQPVVDDQIAFYTAMAEQDVLDMVDYTLYEADENGKATSKEYSIDRGTFWGVSYSDTDKNQAYEPVFRLQVARADAEEKENGEIVYTFPKDENGKVIYNYVDNDGAALETSEKAVYRVVFSGKKAVYTDAGDKTGERDVNGADVNTAEPNYNIVVDAATIEDTAVAINIAAAKETAIDVSAILQDGKGADYANPIESIYDGGDIYAERAEYKKAQVKSGNDVVAKDQDLNIIYEWYRLDFEETDEEGKVIPYWSRYHWANVYAPWSAGVYRLLITYEDPERVYAPAEAEVFYKVNPQFLSVVPSGDYSVYAGTTTQDFLNKIWYDTEYKIYRLKDNQYDPKEHNGEYSFIKDYDELRWFIERENADDTGKGTGEYEEYSGEFDIRYNYRLAVELTPGSSNYANYTVEKQADDTEKTVWFNETLNVPVKPMGETEVVITIDPTKLAATYKEYDGEAIDTSVEGFVTITKASDGSVVTDIPAEELVCEWKALVNDGENDNTYYQSEVRNAGTYSLTVTFEGNEKYKNAQASADDIITITKRPLTVTPNVVESVVAGMTVGQTLGNYNYDDYFLMYDPANVKVEGYAPADKDAFTYRSFEYWDDGSWYPAEGYEAWIQIDGPYDWNDTLSASVYEKDKTNALSARVRYRGNAAYEVKHSATFVYPYSINYNVTYDRASFEPVRGNAIVDGAWDLADDREVDLATTTRDAVDGSRHTIVPMEGVPYVYNLEDEDGHYLTGNYFAFRITAPIEFRDDYDDYDYYNGFFNTFVFENSIKAAGGHIVDTDARNGYIYVAFDAAKDANQAAKSFDIRWEEGYIENFTVDLTKAILEADLEKAVAPKSLAFNGVDTKMAVGETQQLDVKVTKEQISDIICLGYKVDDPSVLSITDGGYVTALSTKGAKSASATVTVYPARMVDGEKVAIAGAKTATVKITVSDVVTPSIKKVTAADTFVTTEYADPANGYRREFYVLEGKNVTVAQFESAIASIRNGAWEDAGFVIAPIYGDGVLNEKTKTRTKTLRGLNPSVDYTIYVRNVSGVRTLDDGTQVAVSAVGAVKSFTTTKSKVTNLNVTLKDVSGNDIYWKNPYVKLSDKTAQANTSGEFTQYYEKDTADLINVRDTVWHDLPLTKEQQNNYVNPKLTYVITEDYNYYTPQTDAEKEKAKKNGYTLVVGDRYFCPTKIATIAKNGKITLKGLGTVYIYAYDSDTARWSDREMMKIIAEADSVKAKSAKVKVGVPVYLSEYLEYKEGNKKLTGAVDYYLSIENLDKVNNDSFSVVDIGGDYILVAKKPGNIDIPVKDLNVEEAGGNGSATIKVKASAIDPVKNLKVSSVVDNYAYITFTYSADADYNRGYAQGEIVGFNIDLKDNRGSIIRNEQIFANPEFYEDEDGYLTVYDDLITGYDSKSNTYTFSYCIGGLTRLSNYKVAVTAIYGDPNTPTSVSKAANVKIKTTDIPASYYDLGKDVYGGIDIEVNTLDNSWYLLSDYPYFTSGNTYTLQANGADWISHSRATDSLTWKSTNTKVATVKANAGTYFATFKAVKSGETTIEVTSKVTKKVIARYRVYVKAVGQADDFYGDYDVDFIAWDPGYANGVEVLTAANPVVVEQSENDYKWVSFTAPEFGVYNFSREGGWLAETTDAKGNPSGVNAPLSKGEKRYFKIYGAFSLSVNTVSSRTLTATAPVTVESSDTTTYISFMAPEDNYYTFTADNSTSFVSTVYRADGTTTNGKYSTDRKSYSLALNAGEEIFLRVYSGDYTVSVKSRETALLSATATSVTVNKDEEKWFVFTAPETGEYTIQSEEATAAVKADYYTGIQSADKSETITPSGTGKDFTFTKRLEKDETVAIRVYTAAETATAKISAVPKSNETLDLDKEKSVSVKKGASQWFTFSVAEDGLYSFDITGTDSRSFYRNGIKDENKLSDYKNVELEAGDIIYICATVPVAEPEVEVAAVAVLAAGEASDTVTIKVKVTKLEATLLTAGKAESLTLADNGEYWYVFTAPEYGRYTLNTVVTKNAEGATHRVSVDRYNKVCGDWTEDIDTYKEEILKAGEEVVLKVTADEVTEDKTNPVTISASITVAEVSFAPFTNNEASLDLAKDGVKWYSFTAAKDATYTFKKDVTAGAVAICVEDSISGAFTQDDFEGTTTAVERTLKAGNTVYFKVVQTSGDTASAGKITVSVPTITEFTETTQASLKKGEPQWFKFTAPKAARYLVTASVAEEAAKDQVTVELHNSLDDAEQTIYADGNFFETGKTVYFKLTTTADTATMTLSVKPIEAKALTAGKAEDVKVKAGADQWYQFTVPENGRYVLGLTVNEGSKDIQTDVYTDNAKTKIDDFTNNHLRSGDTYYICVYTEETTEQSGKLEVKALPIAGAFSLTAPTKVELAEGETKWYTFTATETGTYTFSTDAADITVSAEAYLNTGEYPYAEGSLPLTCALTKDEILHLALSADKAANFNVTVEKKNITPIKVGTNTVTINKDEEQFFSFQPYNDGRFVIKSANLPKDAKIALDGGELSADGFECSAWLEASDAYQFSVTTDAEKAITFDIVVERVLPTDNKLSVGEDNKLTVSGLGKDEYIYVSFTAPEDGRYSIKTDSKTVTVDWQECDEYGNDGYWDDIYGWDYDYASGELPIADMPLTKGTEKLYKIAYTPGESATDEEKNTKASFNLIVTKTETTAITGNSAAVDLEAGADKWYSYTAKAEGWYTFNYGGIEADLYRSITSEGCYSGKTYTIYLEKGEAVYLHVTNDTKEKVTSTITVASVGSEDDIILANGENKIIRNGFGFIWLKYTTAQAGMYTFKADTRFYYYGEDKSSDLYDYGDSFNKMLNAGTTVYMQIVGNRNDVTSITVNGTALETIDPATGSVTTELAAGESKWYTYTAGAAGWYTFNYGGADGELYRDITSSDCYRGKSHTLSMEEGKTVYLYVTNNKATKETVTITVSAGKADENIILTNGENNIIADSYGDMWLQYTAKKTGLYTFYANGNYFYYYGANKDTQESSGYGRITKLLEAGTTVYMKAYGYTNSTTVFTVEGGELVTLTEGGSDTATLAPDAVRYYQFKAKDAGRYSVTQNGTELNIDLYTDSAQVGTGSGTSANAHMLLLDEEQTVYFAVRNDESDSVDVTLSLKREDGAEIAIAEGSTNVDPGTDGVTWLTLTPEAAGDYTFAINGGTLYYYGTKKGGADFEDVNGQKLSLAAGTPVYLKFTGNKNRIITVDHIQFVTVSDGENPITPTKRGKVWMQYTTTQKGIYTFSAENTIYYYGDGTTRLDYGANIMRLLEAGTTVSMYVEGYANSTVTLKVDAKVLHPLSVGTASESVDVAAGDVQYYEFTATAEGRYAFTQKDTALDIDLYTDSTKVGSTYSSDYKRANAHMLSLNANDTVYFAVRNSGAEAVSVTLNAVKGTDGADIAIAEGITNVQPNADGDTWLAFKPTVPGAYACNYSISGYGYGYLYYYGKDRESTEHPSMNSYSDSLLVLDTVDTVYLKYSGSGNCIITLQKLQPEVLTKGDNEFEPDSDDNIWMQYTAESEGKYTFSSESDIYGIYYYGRNIYYISGKSISGLLGKDETVYMRVNTGSPFTVTVAEETITPLSIGESDSVILGKDETRYYKFTAEAAGRYEITQKDTSLNIKFCKNKEKVGIGFDAIANAHMLSLAAGETVYFVVENTQDDPVSVVLKVSQSADESDQGIPIAEGITNVQPNAEGDTWLAFTPDKTGCYQFSGNRLCYYGTEKNEYGIWYSTDNMKPLEEGVTVYLKLLSYGNPYINITVSQIEPFVLSDADQSLDITESGYVWLEYTAQNTGMYTFSIGADKNFKYYGVDTNEVSENVPRTQSTEKFLKAGTKVYLKTDYLNEGDVIPFTVSCEEAIVLSNSIASETVTLEPEAVQYYAFIAPETGRYEITQVGTTLDLKLYTDITKVGSTNSYDYTSANSHMIAMEKGAMVCLVAENSGDEAIANVSLKAAKGNSEVAIHMGTNNVQPDASGETWLTFTPEETGCYQFSGLLSYYGTDKTSSRNVYDMIPLEANVKVYLKTTASSNTTFTVEKIEPQTLNAGENSIVVDSDPVWVQYTANATGMYKFSSDGSRFYYYGEDTISSGSSSTGYSKLLNAGKAVYMKVTSSMTLTVQAITSTVLYDTDVNNVVFETAGDKWIQYTPAADGLYTISAVSGSSNKSFYYYGEDVQSYNSNNSFDRLLKQGKTVYMKVTGTADETVTFTVTKNVVDGLSLNANQISIGSEGVKWLSYTPDADGLYTISAVSGSSEKSFYYYGEDVAKSVSSDSSWTMSLKKDITVYMKVSGANSTPTFTVTKIDPLPLSVDDTSVTIGSDGVSWLTFTPEKDGKYTFSVENNTSYYYYGEEVNAGSNGLYRTSYTILLDKGKTVYLKAAGTVGTTQKFTVDGVEFVELTAGADSDAVSIASEKYQLYEFTAAETGRYAITQKNSSVDLYLYTDKQNIGNTSSYYCKKANAHMLSMNEGDTVYLMAENDQTETASVTLSVAQGEAGADIAIAEGSSYVQPNTGGETWLAFTAKEAGVYSFSYSGNSSIYYYGQDKSSSTSSAANGQPIDLSADETVYLKFESNYYDSTITVEKITFTELTVDTPVTTSIPAGGDSWFVFTASEDGTYKFYSSKLDSEESYPDTKADLYKDKGVVKITSDDDAGNRQFLIECSLLAGETVYLDTYHYSKSNAINYKVYAEKVDSTETTE